MTYIAAADTLDGQAKVIYRSKDGRTSKTLEALDWSRRRAAGCIHSLQRVTHIPNKGEQMVRYYGYYSNKSRGMRKKAGIDDQVPALAESAVSSTAFRRNWARLIQKIYQIDPLLCPKCQGPMKIISFIEDELLIKKYWCIYDCGILETTTRSNRMMRICLPLKLNSPTIMPIRNCRPSIIGPNKALFNGFM